MREHADPSDFAGPVEEARIQAAEEALNLRFPDSYRWFLTTFGVAWWPTTIYGLGGHSTDNVVKMNFVEREEVERTLPPTLLAFSPDGFGNHDCLDMTRRMDGECPVVFWQHDAAENAQPVQTHRDFIEWLEAMIRADLADPDR